MRMTPDDWNMIADWGIMLVLGCLVVLVVGFSLGVAVGIAVGLVRAIGGV